MLKQVVTLNQDEQRKLFVFFVHADKGTQTDCGGSTDLSAVIDCVSLIG